MNIAPPYDLIYTVFWLVMIISVIASLTYYNDRSIK